MDNYFRTADGQVFFFSSNNELNIFSAYRKAKATGQNFCVYKMPRIGGPWDFHPVVGHRDEQLVRDELARCRSTKTKRALETELDSIAELYYNTQNEDVLRSAG